MKSKRIHLKLEDGMFLALKEISDKTERPVSEIVRAAIQHMINIVTDEKGYIKKIEKIETGAINRFYPRYNTNFENRK